MTKYKHCNILLLSFEVMKALGIYKVDVETGEVYKTGLKKGQPKTRKEFRWQDDYEVLIYKRAKNFVENFGSEVLN